MKRPLNLERMTPRARRVVEKRQRCEAERFARMDAADEEERRRHPRPGWYPPTKEREYLRDEDLQQINPGEAD